MEVHQITDIIRKNPLIAYRREYSAIASLSYQSREPKDVKIEFSIELTPLGQSIIKAKIIDTLDYPTLQILNTLRDRVHELDRSGVLP